MITALAMAWVSFSVFMRVLKRISKQHNGVALQPGMIVSNEPGYYREGVFGIRCENLQVVRPSETSQGETPMLEFETLTLVPFDVRMLDTELMDDRGTRVA